MPDYTKNKPYSGYHSFKDNLLSPVFNTHSVGQASHLRARHFHHMMRATIESPSFPCVGAKAALKQNSYRFGYYDDIESTASFKGLTHDLAYFAQEQKDIAGDFTTFITCFDHSIMSSPQDFDDKVWRLLGQLHKEDQTQGSAYDPLASPDADDPHFAFSFAGTAYFVAALSPVSPRLSRQFVVPALVFNAHYQFEDMKAKGKFNKLRDVIRKNDAALEGQIPNSIAADFGETSEAVQYTGITPKPAKTGTCPYHRHYKSP